MSFIGAVSFSPEHTVTVDFSNVTDIFGQRADLSHTFTSEALELPNYHLAFDKQKFLVSLENEQCLIVCLNLKKKMTIENIESLYFSGGFSSLKKSAAADFIFIFDKIKQKFIICHDKHGFFPVYFFYDKKTLYFSSSQKLLLTLYPKKPEINEAIFCELFTLGVVSAPDTLIENIYSMPVTKWLVFDGEVNFETFTFSMLSDVSISGKSVLDCLSETLNPVLESKRGVLASGGLDSSVLATMLAKKMNLPFDLLTVAATQESQEFQLTQHLQKKLKTTNHYFNMPKEGFAKAVVEALILGESEMVGVLSANAAVEYAFADFITQFRYNDVFVGDDYWIVPPAIKQQPPGYYALKQGILNSAEFHQLLGRHTSYLAYYQKYQPVLSEEASDEIFRDYRWEIHAALLSKINGKIRMNIVSAPRYQFPFLSNEYVNLVTAANCNDANFVYRDVLRKFLLREAVFSKNQLALSKMWMPEFFMQDAHFLSRIKCFLKETKGFSYQFFGATVLDNLIRRLLPEKQKTFLLALLYLDIFHALYIEKDPLFIGQFFSVLQ